MMGELDKINSVKIGVEDSMFLCKKNLNLVKYLSEMTHSGMQHFIKIVWILVCGVIKSNSGRNAAFSDASPSHMPPSLAAGGAVRG